MHRALRPAGLLLDVHPEPEPASVETRGPRGAEVVGPLREPTRADQVTTARRALEELVGAGFWRPRRTELFTFLYHFDSPEAWHG